MESQRFANCENFCQVIWRPRCVRRRSTRSQSCWIAVRNCCRRVELPGVALSLHQPRNTLDNQEPTSARSLCISLVSKSFSSRSLLAEEMRRMVKSPFRVFSLMCVKPRKSNVSGGPSPRFERRSAA